MKQEKDYTYRSMRDERQYGLFWYSGLWQVLRPVLVAVAVITLVVGIGTTVWNRLYGKFAAPVDETDDNGYTFEITSGMSLSSVAKKLEGNENPEAYREWCGLAAPVDENDSTAYTFVIDGSMDMDSLADRLEGNEYCPYCGNTLSSGDQSCSTCHKQVSWEPRLIISGDAFIAYCRFAGLEQRITQGTYTLRKNMSMPQIAELFAGNDRPDAYSQWCTYAAAADENDSAAYTFEVTKDMDLSGVADKLAGNSTCSYCGSRLNEGARSCGSCGMPAAWEPQLIRNKAAFICYCEYYGLEKQIEAGTYTLQRDMSMPQIAERLAEPQLIRSKTVFKYYCDFAGMGQKIQVGTYKLRKNMSMQEIAEQLSTGDGNPMVRNITLIPGETIEEFAAKLVSTGVLESDEKFLQLCREGTAFREYEYIDDVMSTKTYTQRKYVLEGYLAPNTYEVYIGADEETIIRKLLSQTEAVFTDELRDQADKQGLTMDQVLILASMIEKEAKETDFAKVSAVFYNRQKRGMPLQSDVTIHYITGIRRMALSNDDISANSPYNTYRITGLPVGPICNPSPAAIRAALYPDETFLAEGYLYFCAKEPESGELYFSKTLEEHNRVVEQYSKSWQEYDRSRGIGQ